MYPLLACSVVGLALFFERLVSLRRSRVIPKPFVQRFLHQVRDGNLDRQRALELCQENRSPVAAVFAGALRKWGRPSVEVEQGIIDAGERVTNGLRKYLRVFSALTVVAPLLGLLGTVIGMIETFNVVAETSVSRGDPQQLAAGISRALLNTAFGLTVAIPAQCFYYFFVGRVDRLIIDMDSLGQELVNLICAEELQNRNEIATTRPRRPVRATEADA
jgi:biopolymer transport protein ExbB